MPLDNTLFLKLLETRQAGMDRQVELKQQELKQRGDIGNTLLDQLGKYQDLKSKQLKDKQDVIKFQLENYGKAGVPAEAVEWSKIPEEVRGIGEAAYLGGSEAHRKDVTDEQAELGTMQWKMENEKANREFNSYKFDEENKDRDDKLAWDKIKFRQEESGKWGRAQLAAQKKGTGALPKEISAELQKSGTDAGKAAQAGAMLDNLLVQLARLPTLAAKAAFVRTNSKAFFGAIGGGNVESLTPPEFNRLFGFTNQRMVDLFGQNGPAGIRTDFDPKQFEAFEKMVADAATARKKEAKAARQRAEKIRMQYEISDEQLEQLLQEAPAEGE